MKKWLLLLLLICMLAPVFATETESVETGSEAEAEPSRWKGKPTFHFALDYIFSSVEGEPSGFSLSAAPGYVSDYFEIELYGRFCFDLEIAPWKVEFNKQNWLCPPKAESENLFNYSRRVASHYLKVVKVLRFGTMKDPFYFLLGRLSKATLGDGALINKYTEAESDKAGLHVKVTAGSFNVSYLTDDLLYPSFGAGRFSYSPFFNTQSFFKKLETGLSVGYLNSYEPAIVLGADAVLPLVSSDNFVFETFFDVVYQIKRSLALRMGLDFEAFSFVNGSASAWVPTSDGFNIDLLTGGGKVLKKGDVSFFTSIDIPYASLTYDFRLGSEGMTDRVFGASVDIGWKKNKVSLSYQKPLQKDEKLFEKGAFTRNSQIVMDGQIQVDSFLVVGEVFFMFDDNSDLHVKTEAAVRVSIF